MRKEILNDGFWRCVKWRPPYITLNPSGYYFRRMRIKSWADYLIEEETGYESDRKRIQVINKKYGDDKK